MDTARALEEYNRKKRVEQSAELDGLLTGEAVARYLDQALPAMGVSRIPLENPAPAPIPRGAPAVESSPAAGVTSDAGVPSGTPAVDSTGARPDQSTALQDTISGLIRQYKEAAGRQFGNEVSNVAAKSAILTPAITNVRSAARAPLPPVPHLADEPKQPDLKSRPFLTAEGANSLQTIVSGLGTIITAVAGLRSPIAALNGLTGAMQGWAEGDATRAEREFKQYELALNRMSRDNAKALELYELARARRADDIQAAQMEYQAALLGAGLNDYAVEVGAKGLDRLGGIIGMTQANLNQWMKHENSVLRDQLNFLKFYTAQHSRELSDKLKQTRLDQSQVRYTPRALRMMAEQYLDGDDKVKTNIGRGMQGPAELHALNEMIYEVAEERGMSGADIAASLARFQGFKATERALGTRSANIELAVNEAAQFAPLLKDASKKLTRSDTPILNRFLKAMNLNLPFDEQLTGAQVQVAAALNSFVNAYARAVNPSGVKTVSDTEHAREMLVDIWGRKTLDAAIDQMMLELSAAQKSPGQVREKLEREFTERTKRKPAGKVTPPAAPVTDVGLEELLDLYK